MKVLNIIYEICVCGINIMPKHSNIKQRAMQAIKCAAEKKILRF
jgi:hypothetical protein